eukprot:m.73909 g.73909  ORF g.73909 m.73909 type:complete len:843 (-) comp13918_c0_seq4:1778-4306(-)
MNSNNGSVNKGRRSTTFLTAPSGGWLHDKFALQYGEGVFFSFPVTYIGRYPLGKSLRTVEFPMRNRIVQEAIARIREEAHTRPPIEREVPASFAKFLDGEEPEIKMEDIVLNISSAGIVLATEKEDAVIAYHRMTTISFAAGGDFEDYDMVAYVAKSRLGRMCYIFDCGDHSNQVLATIGQAFVQAGQAITDQEYEEFDEEYGVYAQQALTEQEYQDLYGTVNPYGLSPTYMEPSDTDAHNYSTIGRGDAHNALYGNGQQQHYYTTPDHDGNDDYQEVAVDPNGYATAQYNEANPDYHEIPTDNADYHDYQLGRELEATYDTASPRKSLKERLKARTASETVYDTGNMDSDAATYAVATDRDTENTYAQAHLLGEDEVDYEATYDVGMSGRQSKVTDDPTYDVGLISGRQSQASGERTYDVGSSRRQSKMAEDPTYDIGSSRRQSKVGGELTYDMGLSGQQSRASNQEDDVYDVANRRTSVDHTCSSPTYTTAAELARQSGAYDLGTSTEELRYNNAPELGVLSEQDDHSSQDHQDDDIPDADAAFPLDPWKDTQAQSPSLTSKAYDPHVAGSYTDPDDLVEEQDETYLEIVPGSVRGNNKDKKAKSPKAKSPKAERKEQKKKAKEDKKNKKISSPARTSPNVEQQKTRGIFGIFGRKKQHSPKPDAPANVQQATESHAYADIVYEVPPAMDADGPLVYEDPDAQRRGIRIADEDSPYAKATNVYRQAAADDDDDDDENEEYDGEFDDTDYSSHMPRKSQAEIEAMYSTISRRNPPALPPKHRHSQELLGSIRTNPLKSKADFLVRKLNSQNGSLSLKAKERKSIPSWNFIDPSALANVKEQ